MIIFSVTINCEIVMPEKLNELICFNFYNGWREVTSIYKNILGLDVTPQKMYVLELLEFNKQITVSELSRGMNLDSSAVSTLLSRMEKKNLVKRTHGTEDRRTVFVELTQEGYDARKEIRSKFNSLMDAIGEDILPEDIVSLQNIVERIRKNHRK